jgi:hypothetical protein
LRVVEVGGDGDNCFFGWLSDISICCFLHLHEDKGSNLWGREGLSF